MIYLKKAWIPGVITETSNRDFINSLYREKEIFYKVDRFDDNLESAVKVADDYIITMINWYKMSITFEVKMIIERSQRNEKVS